MPKAKETRVTATRAKAARQDRSTALAAYYRSAWSSLTTTEARDSFSELLNRVIYRGERVVLSRRGQPVVAMVPLEDLKLLEELEDRVDLEAARKALAEAKEKGTVSWEKLKTKLGL